MIYRKHLNTKGFSHHLLLVLIILVVGVGGVYVIVKGHADYIKPHVAAGPPPPTCASEIPSVTNNPEYPLLGVTKFGSAANPLVYPTNFQFYQSGILSPKGFISPTHYKEIGYGIQLKGYVDPISKHTKGDTGTGFDLNPPVVPGSGGYDICFQMSQGNWQDVHLVILAWPTDNQQSEGEVDMFEGNPQNMDLHIHVIGSNPQYNAATASWPSNLSSGIHLVSARWDPIDGYRFYLDNSLFDQILPTTSCPTTNPYCFLIQVPTTNHQISIQMQDTKEDSTTPVKSPLIATVYWVAAYSYAPPAPST